MKYALFVLIALISAFAVCVFGARKGTVDFDDKLKLYKDSNENIVPLRGIPLILTITIGAVLLTAVQIALYKNTVHINFVKLYGTAVLVFAAAIVDSKRRIIPNALILFGLALRAGVYVWELFADANMKAVVTGDLLGGGIGFGILALACVLSKGGIGFGDAKLFGIIGITSGPMCTFSSLMLSLLVSLAFSIVGIATKKMGRKDAFPFGPCIAIGYFLAIILRSY